MATYAAYRHVELDNVGYGKKRVLKPPGGGSSDIFGPAGESTSPRRKGPDANKSTLGSSFFNDDTQVKQTQQQVASTPSSNGSSAPETPRSKPDGNPVTGMGYENSNGQQNGNGSSASSEKSSTDSSPSVPANPLRLKNRVPPGGFSSGLW